MYVFCYFLIYIVSFDMAGLSLQFVRNLIFLTVIFRVLLLQLITQ